MGFLEIRYHWFAAAVVLAICLPNYALANCEAILSLSKVKSITISSKDRFQRRLDNYCKEQRNSSGRSASGGISIGGIGLSGAGGSSNQSYEQYCQENQNADAAEEAYKQYVESISPRAYDAYEQCLKSTDVDFDLTAVNPKQLTLLVSFRSSTSVNRAAVAYVVTGNEVTCEWRNQTATSSAASPTQTIENGQTFVLQCTRKDYQQESPITVYRADSSNRERLTIPWRRYNDEGVPVDTIEDLTNKVEKVNSDLQTAVSALRGTASVKLYKCPMGWKNPDAAQNADWIYMGCQGQISTLQKCVNGGWHGPGNPLNTDEMTCDEIGEAHLFSPQK